MAGPPRLLNVFVSMALVARYADCAAVLRDHEHFSSVPPRSRFLEERISVFGDAPRVVFSDPPVHTRLRRLVSRAFTPRRIRELEPKIREFTTALLDRAAGNGGLDVMADLANPLPVMVISHMLGVPHEHYPMFKQWSDTVIESDNTPPGMPLPQNVRDAFTALREYFIAEIEKRRRNPGDDLVSVLVAAHEGSDEVLSEAELVAFVVILLLAGNETTTNLIGNGMLALTRHPGQLERLGRSPELMPSAIEEMLRYDGPVQATMRHIPAGHRYRGHHGDRGLAHLRAAGGGQPRPRRVQRTRDLRHRTHPQSPPGVGRRNSLLDRRAAGPDGRGNRDRLAAGALQANPARHAGGAAEVQGVVFPARAGLSAARSQLGGEPQDEFRTANADCDG